MNVRELIAVLEKLNPDLPVCAESETCTWDIEAYDVTKVRNVRVVDMETGGWRDYPEALFLGYVHRTTER